VFAGSHNDVASFFACFNVFPLTSCEDPFPLVCLEAASLRKPIICFEKAGGMPGFVGSDAGKVVPYGDIDAFCREIINFHDNSKKLEECGRIAQKRLMTGFSAESSCRKICELLLKWRGSFIEYQEASSSNGSDLRTFRKRFQKVQGFFYLPLKEDESCEGVFFLAFPILQL
jgi:hypothetical protein